MTNIEFYNFLLNEPLLLKLDLSNKNPAYLKYNKTIFKTIHKLCPEIKSCSELIYLAKNLNYLSSLHIFCKCGNKNTFTNPKKGYYKFCSVKCKSNSIEVKNKIKNTIFTNYGTDNYSKTDEYKNLYKNQEWVNNKVKKGKNTCLKRYNVDSYSKTNEFKDLYNNKEFVKQIQLKIRSKILYKYGETNYSKTEIFKNLFKNKHFVDNRTRKSKNTLLKNHGDKNWNNRPKARKTMRIKYGKDNYSQTDISRNRYYNKQFVNNFIKKQRSSKKKNNTYGTSNMEDMIHQLLIYKFDFEDVIRQYYDENRYPFSCDFYIKSLDLFIELNFYWTHGFEPYDKDNVKHQEQLINWIKNSQEINFKQEKKSQYRQAIYIWTTDDVNKFKTAKQNKLNYLTFYNLEQFLDWLCPLIDTSDQ